MSTSEMPPEAPVVFLVFNRPEHTRKSFQTIRAARPKKLFVLADGPRNPGEMSLCMETRKITEEVDWDCEVERRYFDTNKGCDYTSTTGIAWALTKVDRILFLEDDSLPHPDFFHYCAELLEKYKDDERIMTICGNSNQKKNPNFTCQESYYFSTTPTIHAIAVWRRSWKHYDADLKAWPEVKRRGLLESVFPHPAVRAHFEYKFSQYYAKKLTNWDGVWIFACIVRHGLSIVPRVNLVSNIGYGPGATNTTNADSEHANLPVEPLPSPLVHPSIVMTCPSFDRYTYKYIFGINRSPVQRTISFTRHYFPKIYATLQRIHRAVAAD
jgi:hypothetical protein